MSGPLVLVASWVLKSTAAFTPTSIVTLGRRRCKLFSTSATLALENGISRLSLLQTLLTKHGAPGSQGCNLPNDLVPLATDEAKNLLTENPELTALHPHLYPIAQSQESGNFICALRRAYADDAQYESSSDAPWPIVESALGAPGMQLLALNR